MYECEFRTITTDVLVVINLFALCGMAQPDAPVSLTLLTPGRVKVLLSGYELWSRRPLQSLRHSHHFHLAYVPGIAHPRPYQLVDSLAQTSFNTFQTC